MVGTQHAYAPLPVLRCGGDHCGDGGILGVHIRRFITPRCGAIFAFRLRSNKRVSINHGDPDMICMRLPPCICSHTHLLAQKRSRRRRGSHLLRGKLAGTTKAGMDQRALTRE